MRTPVAHSRVCCHRRRSSRSEVAKATRLRISELEVVLDTIDFCAFKDMRELRR